MKNIEAMNKPQTRSTPDQDAPKNVLKHTALRIKEVHPSVSLSRILYQIRGADILLVKRSGADVLVYLFGYFDTFRMKEKLGGKITVDGFEYVVVSDVAQIEEDRMERIRMAHSTGGTRNVMLANLEDFMKEDFLREECEKYGEIESLRYFKDKKLVYVEYFSFISAMELVKNIYQDTLFQNVKIVFGKDKCGVDEIASGVFQNNRTVYLGNVMGDVSAADVLEMVQGGPVFGIKLVREKKCAFVTFFDYVSASAFLEYGNTFSILINGTPSKLGGGKIQPLPAASSILAYNGVTRLISVKLNAGVSQSRIESEMAQYGEIEKIEKSDRFMTVSYSNLLDAHAAYTQIEKTSHALSVLLNGFVKDPCSATTATDLMLLVQKKELGL